MSSLRSFAAGVVTLVLCRVLVGLPLGSCCSSGLRGSVLCLVCMLVTCLWYGLCSSSATIVALLSLPWLGLLLVFVWFLYLRLTLWASACVGPHGFPTFSRVGAAPSTWAPLLCPGCGGFLPPCSFSSGWCHPFGSLVSFVTIDRQRRFPLEGFFFWVVASYFGVVS